MQGQGQAIAAIVVMIAAFLAAGTLALAAPIDLSWTGQESCPAQEELAARVAELSAGREISGSTPVVHARLHALRLAPGRWRLDLATDAPFAGERTFEGASCADVASAAAVVLAMLLRPHVAPAATQKPALLDANTTVPEPHSWRLTPSVLAGAWLDALLLPGPAPGPLLGVGIGAGRIELAASAFITTEARTSAAGREGGGLFRATGGLLTACMGQPAPRRVAVAPCLVAEVVAVHGRGFGVSDPRERWRLIPRVGADLLGRFGVGGHLSIFVAAGPRWNSRGATYTLDETARLHATPRVSVAVTLGVAARWR